MTEYERHQQSKCTDSCPVNDGLCQQVSSTASFMSMAIMVASLGCQCLILPARKHDIAAQLVIVLCDYTSSPCFLLVRQIWEGCECERMP